MVMERSTFGSGRVPESEAWAPADTPRPDRLVARVGQVSRPGTGAAASSVVWQCHPRRPVA